MITLQREQGEPWLCQNHSEAPLASGLFSKKDVIRGHARLFKKSHYKCPACGCVEFKLNRTRAVLSRNGGQYYTCLGCNETYTAAFLRGHVVRIGMLADIVIYEKYRGKGHGMEMMEELKKAFDMLVTGLDESSEGGRALCKKAGMIENGTLLIWKKEDTNAKQSERGH